MEIRLGTEERQKGRRLAVELLTERVSARDEEAFLERLGHVMADAGDLATVAATLRAATFLASTAIHTAARLENEDPTKMVERLALFLENEPGEP